MTENTTPKMISIWFWVGLVLGVYGLIITGTGIYYIFEPAALAGKIGGNPNLWWGIIMTVAGAIFLVLGKFDRGVD